ncbi:MAG TPA: hypothetical protein VL966_18305 [Alphaproteobacteria bacterium]|nr:hypothetical protein [Alphaproteobacteria bacterium]
MIEERQVFSLAPLRALTAGIARPRPLMGRSFGFRPGVRTAATAKPDVAFGVGDAPRRVGGDRLGGVLVIVGGFVLTLPRHAPPQFVMGYFVMG